MGIVNVTPDSFSDGGRYSTPRCRGRTRPATGRRRGRHSRHRRRKHASLQPGVSMPASELERVIPGDRGLAPARAGADLDRHLEGRRGPRGLGGRCRNHQRRHGAGMAIAQMIDVARETQAGVCRHAHARHAANDAGQPDIRRRGRRRARLLARLPRRIDRRGNRPPADRARPGHRLRQDPSAQHDADGPLPAVSRAGLSASRWPFAEGIHRQDASATRQADRTAGTIGVCGGPGQPGRADPPRPRRRRRSPGPGCSTRRSAASMARWRLLVTPEARYEGGEPAAARPSARIRPMQLFRPSSRAHASGLSPPIATLTHAGY